MGKLAKASLCYTYSCPYKNEMPRGKAHLKFRIFQAGIRHVTECLPQQNKIERKRKNYARLLFLGRLWDLRTACHSPVNYATV